MKQFFDIIKVRLKQTVYFNALMFGGLGLTPYFHSLFFKILTEENLMFTWTDANFHCDFSFINEAFSIVVIFLGRIAVIVNMLDFLLFK